jgi:peptidyl-prolyl cis-trans isomerase B (cyclophilin B)
MHWKRAARHLAVALLVGSSGVFGCGKSEPPKAQNESDNAPQASAPSNSGDVKPPVEKERPPVIDSTDDGFHHPFVRAVRTLDNPPIGCSVRPVTVSGKSVFKVYKDVVAQWDGIRFTTQSGKRIHYSATIVTALGEIEIELRPDLAPNHVRSFVALARAGYYDRLFFDRVNHEEYDNNPGVRNDFLEAGCPTGTGEDGFGNVGYWLYPETQPSEKATHIEGTVGACHGIEKDSAGCKFYISLSKAPFNDTYYTIFGQVTRGLDVAKKIFAQPIAEEDRGHFGCLKPEHPMMIDKVIIHTDEVAEGRN